MPFALIGGLISGAGSLFGGLAASSGSADISKAASRAADLQGQEYLDIANKMAPFLKLGTTGADVLGSYFGIDQSGAFNPNAPFLQPISATIGAAPNISPSDPALRNAFSASPGYSYALTQANDAAQNSGAARTGAVSGNMLQALQKNAVGLANQDWNKWFDQYTNNAWNNYGQRYQDVADQRNSIINYLTGITGTGQSAAAQTGSFGQQAASNIGSSGIYGALARASGNQGLANSFSNFFSNPYTQQGINSGLSYLFGGNNQYSGGNWGGGGDFAAYP